MAFELPTEQFNYIEHAKNKVLRANQLEDTIVSQFKIAYEDFWGVQLNQGSKYTVEQMQSILEAMPMTTAIQILTTSSNLVDYITTSYNLPIEYQSAAFSYTFNENGIQLTELKEEWAIKEIVEEVNE